MTAAIEAENVELRKRLTTADDFMARMGAKVIAQLEADNEQLRATLTAVSAERDTLKEQNGALSAQLNQYRQIAEMEAGE